MVQKNTAELSEILSRSSGVLVDKGIRAFGRGDLIPGVLLLGA